MMMFRKALFKNWQLKLIALVCAIVLELYIYNPNNRIENEFSLPIELKNIPKDMVLVWPPYGERGLYADLTISGSAPIIENYKKQKDFLRVDLAELEDRGGVKTINKLKPGKNSLNVSYEFGPKNLSLPFGVDIVSIKPKIQELRFEKILTKDVPVKIDFEGKLAEKKELKGYSIKPQSVRVSGPMSEVESLTEIFLDQKVDLDGAKSGDKFELKLSSPSFLIKLSEDKVIVQVEVGDKEDQISYIDIPYTVVSADDSNLVFSHKLISNITVAGDQNLISQLTKNDIKINVNPKNINEQGKIPVEVNLPKGLRLLSVIPHDLSLVSKKAN